MISDFDKQNMADLLANKDGRFDWFSAKLLRFMAGLREDRIVKFASMFPEAGEVLMMFIGSKLPEIAQKKYRQPKPFATDDERIEAFADLLASADLMNYQRLVLSAPDDYARIMRSKNAEVHPDEKDSHEFLPVFPKDMPGFSAGPAWEEVVCSGCSAPCWIGPKAQTYREAHPAVRCFCPACPHPFVEKLTPVNVHDGVELDLEAFLHGMEQGWRPAGFIS